MKIVDFSERPSLKNPNHLISALSKIEGQYWAEQQRRSHSKLTVNYSAEIYREAIQYQSEIPDSTVVEIMRDIDEDSVIVYGNGGYNRYLVIDGGYLKPLDSYFHDSQKLALARSILG